MSDEYLEDLQSVAQYLRLPFPEFLAMRNDGRIPDLSRPRDPVRVYFKDDLDKWLSSGRPCQGRMDGPLNF